MKTTTQLAPVAPKVTKKVTRIIKKDKPRQKQKTKTHTATQPVLVPPAVTQKSKETKSRKKGKDKYRTKQRQIHTQASPDQVASSQKQMQVQVAKYLRELKIDNFVQIWHELGSKFAFCSVVRLDWFLLNLFSPTSPLTAQILDIVPLKPDRL